MQLSALNYIMFHNFIEKMLHEDEDVEDASASKVIGPETKPQQHLLGKKEILTLVLIFVFALATRLYVLFFVTNPVNAGAENWYSDVYHHWQIAYLSQQIGFHQGFLRLWDIKGLEYFWGLMHPLIGSFLIWATGSTSIVVFRLLSLFCGSVGLVFLFLIVRKNWGYSAGLAASLIGIFNPVGMFNDASGMVEPMGMMFMLGGIYFVESVPWLAGLLLALASATRAEYWLLSVLIVGVMLFFKHGIGKKISFFVGYLIPILLYMKYLLTYTGNPIYPVWWNYLGNAAGAWQAKIPPTIEQLSVQKIYIGLTVVGLIGLIWSIKAGKKNLPLMLFGFGNWVMWGVTIGMTKYLLSYLPRFWVDRIMIWPYLFLAVLISATLFYYLPRIQNNILRVFAHSFSWVVVIVVILATQLLWQPIWHYYSGTIQSWQGDMEMGKAVGEYIGPDGSVLIPEYWPPVTYSLVNYGHVSGTRIVGQMFDPYYYIDGDAYQNWGENRKTVLAWFKSKNIKYMFFTQTADRYMELVKRESPVFEEQKFFPQWGIYIYKINLDNINI